VSEGARAGTSTSGLARKRTAPPSDRVRRANDGDAGSRYEEAAFGLVRQGGDDAGPLRAPARCRDVGRRARSNTRAWQE
jgi:hypothetical protein